MAKTTPAATTLASTTLKATATPLRGRFAGLGASCLVSLGRARVRNIGFIAYIYKLTTLQGNKHTNIHCTVKIAGDRSSLAGTSPLPIKSVMDAYGVVASDFWLILPPSLSLSQTHTLRLTVSHFHSGVSLPSWVDANDNGRRDECR